MKTLHNDKHLGWVLGTLAFSLRGEGPVFDYLAEEFSGLPELGDLQRAILDIRLVPRLPNVPEGAVVAGAYTGWRAGYQYRTQHLRYQINKEGQTYKLQLDTSTHPVKFALTRVLRQFVDLNFLTQPQTLAKNFMYNAFNLVTAILLAQSGEACYLHASSFHKMAFGVAILASGGAGKTTSMLRAIMADGWKYLSDDIALIDKHGTLIRTPLRMQVYAYNTAGNKRLTQLLLDSRSWIDRISWHLRLWLKGAHRTRRRVSAEELFGEGGVGSATKCELAIFMDRANIDEPTVTRIPKSELIWRVNCIMPKEIGGLDDLSEHMHLMGCTDLFLDKKSYLTACEDILESALGNTELLHLRIPIRFSPDSLYSLVSGQLSEVACHSQSP